MINEEKFIDDTSFVIPLFDVSDNLYYSVLNDLKNCFKNLHLKNYRVDIVTNSFSNNTRFIFVFFVKKTHKKYPSY